MAVFLNGGGLIMTSRGHLDENGRARMVDVSDKPVTPRSATASVLVRLSEESYQAARGGQAAKGDVVTVAKLAGIQAAKKTAEWVPLCHPIPIEHVDIAFRFDDASTSLTIRATVRTHARTGAEMEALCACAAAALTVYDMLKAVQPDILITDLKLLEKQGGKSGAFVREDS
jgi:cyclic pyranopterin phosphate synthase